MDNHELGRFRIKTEGDDRAARAIKKPDNKETHFCNLSKVVLAHGSLKVFYSHLKKNFAILSKYHFAYIIIFLFLE